MLVGIPFAFLIALNVYKYFAKTVRKDHSLLNAQDKLAVLVILMWVIFNLQFSSQHVFTNRDPATYAVTGAWLIQNESVKIQPIRTYESIEQISNSSGGFTQFPKPDGNIYSQGSHLLPTLLGVGGRVIGLNLMLTMNTLFGAVALVALYGFMRQVTKPYWGLVTLTAFALSLPFIYFSRDTYTEPLTLAFIFCGLSLMTQLPNIANKMIWFVTGLLFGAAALVRIDAYLALIAPIIFSMLYLLESAGKHQLVPKLVNIFSLFMGATLAAVLAWVDVSKLSPAYYRDVRQLLLGEFIIVGCVIILGTILVAANFRISYWERLKLGVQKYSKRIAYTILALLIVALLRPLWQLNPDHSELTAYWPLVYLGPGIGLIAYLGLADSVSYALKNKNQLLTLLPFTLLVMTMMAIYFITPKISSDQIWATRRQLPIILPGLAVFAALGLQKYTPAMYSVFKKGRGHNVINHLVIISILWPLVFAGPILMRKDTARLEAIHQSCEVLPESSSILLVGLAGYELMMPLRNFCQVEAVRTLVNSQQKLQKETVLEFSTLATANKLTPIVAVYKHELIFMSHEILKESEPTGVNASFFELEQARRRPPLRMLEQSVEILYFKVDAEGMLRPANTSVLNSGKK